MSDSSAWEHLKNIKEEKKRKQKETTVKFLDDNNIKYSDTKIYNVVKVSNLTISLLSPRGKVKCKQGRKWILYSKKEFLKLLK